MKDVIKMIVQVIHFLSFCGVILAGILGVIYEIIGHAKFEQILSTIGITKGFERIWTASAVMLLLLIITHFIKVKLLAN